VLLTPNTLIVPHSPSSLITIPIAALAGLTGNVIVRGLDGQIPARAFARTPIHDMFFVFLVVSFVTGVALAQSNISIDATSHAWLPYVFDFVAFVVVLAAVRTLDDETVVVRMLTVLLAVLVIIAIVEHIVGSSYARWFFHGSSQIDTTPASPLKSRDEASRVRASSDFALAFAWIVAALIPIALGALVTTGRRRTDAAWRGVFGRLRERWQSLTDSTPREVVVWAVIALCVLALYWSRTRSIAAPLVVTFVALAVTPVARGIRLSCVVALAVIGFAYFASGSVSHAFSEGADQASITSRLNNFPSVTQAVVGHSLHGLGFTALQDIGFQNIDSSFLLLYAEIGVIGLCVFGLLYATVIVCLIRGALSQDLQRRFLAVAVTLAVGALMGAALTFDATTIPQNQFMLFALAAFGVVVVERSVGPPRWLSLPTPSRLAAVAAALAGGFVLYYEAPTHVSTTYDFQTFSVRDQDEPSELSLTGQMLVNSVCNTLAVADFTRKPVELTCRPLDPSHGFGEIRAQAPDADTALRALREAFTIVHSIPRLAIAQDFQVQPFTVGRPAALRTAPVWLPLTTGLAVLLLPGDPGAAARHRGRTRRRLRRVRAG
jgi:hypothetical protein